MDFYTSAILHKGYILSRGYLNGEKYHQKHKCTPYLFTDTDEKTEYSTIDNKSVKRIDFDSTGDAREFIKKYEDVSGFSIYGMMGNYQYPWINDNYPGQIEFDPSQVKIASIDIEVFSSAGFPEPEEAKWPITAITVGHNRHYTVFCYLGFEIKDIDNPEFKADKKEITVVVCENEKQLLVKFMSFYKKLDPDIITGWNVDGFDIPYLYNRIKSLGSSEVANTLSPWGIVNRRETTKYGHLVVMYDPLGVAIVDYLQLYKKFRFKVRESYKLDYIAHVELKMKKMSYDEYGTLANLYNENYQLYIEYNIMDVWLVDELDKKLNFLDQLLTIAYDAKINFEDVFGTVKPWDVIIHNYLINKNIVVPPITRHFVDSSIAGGYVKEPRLGMTEWVVSFDLTSLYPSIIRQFNLSPENLRGEIPLIDVEILDKNVNSEIISYLKENNLTMTANGQTWDCTAQGFFPALVTKMFDERVMYKNRMIDAKKELVKFKFGGSKDMAKEQEISYKISKNNNMQMAKKIMINSLYGAAANQYFRFFSRELAEGITLTGQIIIKWAEKELNRYMNKIFKTNNLDYVVAVDTDSVYLDVSHIVKKFNMEDKSKDKIVEFIDQISEQKLKPLLVKSYEDFANYLNVFENTMHMDRENIGKIIICAKKRYIMNVYDNEGVRYSEPELKIMGIEAVRSSTPESCRDAIKEALKIIMEGDEPKLQEYISKFKAQFFKLPVEDISFPRGVTDLEKWRDGNGGYIIRTPAHVKASILYNNLLDVMELPNYQKITSGSKIKFCYLKEPNILRDKVIGFDGILPPEFELNEFIDYELMFDKAYLSPMKTIVNSINWKTAPVATLEELFG